MTSNDFLQSLSARLAALFPAADAARKDLEGRIHGLLLKNFDRLNLITRDDFDARVAALARAEQTIAALEARIEVLEQQCASMASEPPPPPQVRADDQTSGS